MLAEFVSKILSLDTPNISTHQGLEYSDKRLDLITPPAPGAVQITTLQGLVDLFEADLDDAQKNKGCLVHVTGPKSVELISRESDDYGRRRTWVEVEYPMSCKPFPFGTWLNTENFIIGCQACFQRVKIELADGAMTPDLDYVLRVASAISSEGIETSEDDGISQKASMRRGIVLKGQETIRPIVNLAPYRTFAEIDQVISGFVFRARQGNGGAIELALFEADGGRWQLAAVDAIVAWLKPQFKDVAIIS
jgi:hypothetical protein